MYTVRQPPEDEAHARLYDYDLTDHLIVAQEWFHGVKYFYKSSLPTLVTSNKKIL